MYQHDEPDALRAAAARVRRLAELLSNCRDRAALESLARECEESALRIADGAESRSGSCANSSAGGGPDGAASGWVHGPDRD